MDEPSADPSAVALYFVDVGTEEVLDGGHVRHIVLICMLAAETRGIRGAVHQRDVRFVGKTGPAHQRIADELAGAACLEEGAVRMAAQKIGFVAGEHAFGVVSVGVGVIGKVELGQIQTQIRLRSVFTHMNAVLDHVRFAGCGRAERPARIVTALVADRRDIAVIAAVVLLRQIRLQRSAVRLHGSRAVLGIRAAVRTRGQKSQTMLCVFRIVAARPCAGSVGECRGNQAQNKNHNDRKGKNSFRESAHAASPRFQYRYVVRISIYYY